MEISSKKTHKKKVGALLKIYNLRHYRPFLTEKWLCYNQKRKMCTLFYPMTMQKKIWKVKNDRGLPGGTNTGLRRRVSPEFETLSRVPKGARHMPEWFSWGLLDFQIFNSFQYFDLKMQKIIYLQRNPKEESCRYIKNLQFEVL